MIKKFLRSPLVLALLFVLSAGLIVFGTVNGVRANPRIQSTWYGAEVELTNIEVALTEQGVDVEGEDTLLGEERFLTPNGIEADLSNFEIGHTYKEELGAHNIGTIDQFVRVTVYKYWTDGNGKRVDLDPSLIDLHFVTGNGWEIDEAASTPERTVLYYTNPKTLGKGSDDIKGGFLEVGELSAPFTDTLTISGKTVTAVSAKRNADGSEKYDYEGLTFKIKATVDAVQTHNTEDALVSAWGRTN